MNEVYRKCKHWYHFLDWNEMPNTQNKLSKEIQDELITLGKKREKRNEL